jgi:serine protease Do
LISYIMKTFLGLAILFAIPPLQADEPKKKSEDTRSVEELAEQLKPSIAVITVRGREARRESIGTGFVIDANGLIATNLHVIGEGRAIQVELNNKKYEVTAVHASDRPRDLAIIRIDAKDLKAIPLGDPDKMKEGQAVVALGNPQGLRYSVVNGVLSGKRDIDGQSMLQLAMPVEPGNSGGPVIDMQGRVQGIMTLKSALTENLGFAMSVNGLKTLIAKPNPIPMQHWLTIGTLDPDEWKSFMGSRWHQRAGRILVEGSGTGFGGRSICVNQSKPPKLPYEVAVTVKLNDERGAAGLIFHHDGERHYGFYPTGGKLRFTRFDGPDVFSWKILEDISTSHYQQNEWNTLKVRLTKDGIQGYVNDQLVLESKDIELTEGQVGLAKFRETQAEFKNFQLGKEIASKEISADQQKTIAKILDQFKPIPANSPEAIGKLTKEPGSTSVIRDKARELEQQAAQLRKLAAKVHQQRTLEVIGKLLTKPENEIDLIHIGLLIAKLDNEELDVDVYRNEIERMATKIRKLLPKDADDKKKLQTLNQFFFEERGFHGSRSDYYNKSNSYLNEVIDDREGIPITLSILYMELAKRIDLNLVGIGLPGHFVVRHLPKEGEGDFLDVFDRGGVLSKEEVDKRIQGNDALLEPMKKQAVLVRMMRNLLGLAQEEQDFDAGLRYLDTIVLIDPNMFRERFMRAAIRYSKGMKQEAKEDVHYLIDHPSEEVDSKRLQELKRLLESGN